MLIKPSWHRLQQAKNSTASLGLCILLSLTSLACADTYKTETKELVDELRLADKAGLTLVASIRPLAFLLNELVLPADKVIQLVSDNNSAHHYQLKVSDRRLLQSADLVVWVGPELELFLEKPLKQVARSGGESVITLSDASGITWFDSAPESPSAHGSHIDNMHDGDKHHDEDKHRDQHSDHDEDKHRDQHSDHGHDPHENHDQADYSSSPNSKPDTHHKDAHGHDDHAPKLANNDKDAHGHGHDDHTPKSANNDKDAHGHDDHAPKSANNDKDAHAHKAHQTESANNKGDAHDDHQHGGRDPHIWLNPINVQAMVKLLAARLGKLSPENAAAYQQKAQALIQALSRLDQDIAQQMAGIVDKPFTVLHPAYSHFVNRYQLKQLDYLVINPESPIGAKHLYELSQYKMTCVFGEVGQGNQHIERIAAAAKAQVGQLDPLGSNLADDASITELLQGLADDFEACLG
jgi:zinc transport system substrate-binding protein